MPTQVSFIFDDGFKNSCLKIAEASHAPLFLYMLHGLDDEGWGPIRESGLHRALDFIAQSDSLHYAPLDQLLETLTP